MPRLIDELVFKKSLLSRMSFYYTFGKYQNCLYVHYKFIKKVVSHFNVKPSLMPNLYTKSSKVNQRHYVLITNR